MANTLFRTLCFHTHSNDMWHGMWNYSDADVFHVRHKLCRLCRFHISYFTLHAPSILNFKRIRPRVTRISLHLILISSFVQNIFQNSVKTRLRRYIGWHLISQWSKLNKTTTSISLPILFSQNIWNSKISIFSQSVPGTGDKEDKKDDGMTMEEKKEAERLR